ncbi:methionine sulfoxide reductase [Chryseobacterium glaciei]|uniref:Methionine sulfoxide reductase n=1 Tax=Chryseobacterium glaciei TaxID=1685010 RepID=A0A172Y256_9FLAO|nr:GIY-YIG nuclease family protein [Chryseobacterium glaciei]ANF53175.1 methionine sulfoxide reductase [Chryseobacterium glaciei]
MKLGKSIRIYLKEGSVSGIKLAELVNLTIQSLSCPRNKITELNSSFQNQVNTQGVYFLVGTDDETGKPKVYIGEAENVWERLKNHAINKDFWTEVILFTSKDDNITKSHIKYLESRLIEITKEAERYILDNSNTPTLTLLPLPDRDAMEEFIQNIKLLNGVLGYKFLEKQLASKRNNDSLNNSFTIQEKSEKELFFNSRTIVAKAIQTDEGVVVLSGSEVSENESANYGYKTLREELILDTTISKDQLGKLVFNKDHLFKSPSAAAAVIVGYSINGRRSWKNKDGKTLDEIEKSKIK